MDTTRFIGAAFAALVVSLGSSASADRGKTGLIDHEVLPRVCSEALQTQGRSLAPKHRYGNRAPAYGYGKYNGNGKHKGHKKHNRYGNYQRQSYQKTLVAHHPNGVRAVRLTRRDGKLKGNMVCKYRNGVTAFRANFRRGRMDGNMTQNYRNGAPMLHAYFRHGRPEGVTKTYFRNGQPSFRARYQDGEYQGRVKRWYPTGQLAFVATYDCGQLIGRPQHFAAYRAPAHRPQRYRATKRTNTVYTQPTRAYARR